MYFFVFVGLFGEKIFAIWSFIWGADMCRR